MKTKEKVAGWFREGPLKTSGVCVETYGIGQNGWGAS